MDLPTEETREVVAPPRPISVWGVRMTCAGAIVVTVAWVAFLITAALFLWA
jgi:hypothetical protein